MTGHSDATTGVESVYWPDAEIERISIDYEALVLEIRQASGQLCELRCSGYIGYVMEGFWDEIAIDAIKVTDDEPLIDACVGAIESRFSNGPPSTGCVERNEQNWRALRIRLSDGAEMKVVASRFYVVQIGSGEDRS